MEILVTTLALIVLGLIVLGHGGWNFLRHRSALSKHHRARKTSLKKRADDGP